MKDFAGNELAIGDKVLICLPHYSELVWAEVEKFTEKMIICSYQPNYHNARRVTAPRYPSQVIYPLTERVEYAIQAESQSGASYDWREHIRKYDPI
jgi:hypothetical protein